LCAGSCTIDFRKWAILYGFMTVDLQISIKDCRRIKNLKVLLFRPLFPCRGFMVRMDGKPWPRGGGPASLTRVLAALRKGLVRATAGFGG
jgi:hypothetical protein